MTHFLNSTLSRLFLALGLGVLLATSSMAQAPANKGGDQVPVIDPFARNVKRPAQYGAIPVPKPREERKSFSSSIDAQYQYDDDLARLPDLRNYRVISLSTKPAANKPIILGPVLRSPGVGTSARKVYLRLYSHGLLAYARQFVFDFYDANKKLVDANFIIRRDKEEGRGIFRVDMGPFVNERHAMMYCAQIVVDKTRGAQSCTTTREFQTTREQASFRSSATVGLSSSMVNQISTTNKGLDPGRLFGAAYEVAEGETLGRNEFVVIKISQRGVYLAGESGHLFLLPADIIPLPASADEVEE
jgi:hypothetical protein